MAEAKNDVEKFRLWATSLGCPPEAIPSQDALESVFKSPQRDFFYTIMKRVRPRQEVEAFRRHILVTEVQKLGGNEQLMTMPASLRAFLPQKLQTCWEVQNLKNKHAESKSRLEEYKKEYESLAGNLKTKNIQVIKAKQKRDLIQAKVSLLKLKSKSLDTDIKKEEELKAHLLKYMPLKLSANNASDTSANIAVEQAVKELDAFYEFCHNNSNPHALETAKDDLWSKLRNLFYKVPNCLLFNAIMTLKEQELQFIMELNKKKLEDSSLRNLSLKEPMNPFEKELMKTKIDLLALVVKHREAIKERKQIEESFYNQCSLFVNEFQKKVCEFNTNESEERIDEVISEYIVQYNSRAFYKAQNEFLQQEIDKCHAEIEQNAKKLKNHEAILGTVKQTYSDINLTISTVQQDMMQLGQIKDKIMFSRNIIKHKFNDLQVQSSCNELAPTGINTIDSFESGAESLLCSTQLDWDASFAASNTSMSIMKRSFALGDTTLVSSTETRSLIPQHSLELSIFADIPLEKFSFLKDCAFYLAPNPLIIESRELSSTLQLAPGTLLTPNAALEEVRNRILWADLIALHSADLKLELNSELTTVDLQNFKACNKAQRERFTELLDKIEITGIRTNRILQETAKMYYFIVDNPLRLYMPAAKLFNNRNYSEFEAEFKMYFRMATVGASIKADD